MFLLQSNDGGEVVFDSLVIYGPLAVFVIAFALGLIVAKPIYDRAIFDRDRAETQRDAVTKDVLEKVAPVLERAIATISTRANTESSMIEALADTRRVLNDVRRQLERQN
jgi:hypothetical protein